MEIPAQPDFDSSANPEISNNQFLSRPSKYRLFLKVFAVLFLLIGLASGGVYAYQNWIGGLLSTSIMNSTTSSNTEVKKESVLKTEPVACPNNVFDISNITVDLNYRDRTNLSDPTIKARTDEDLAKVKEILTWLPLIGQTSVYLSAQARYGYDFQSVTPGQLGQYYVIPNYAFVNMEEQSVIEHLILHEMGGHYLSVGQNLDNLKNYLTSAQIEELTQTEISLITSIKKYKQKDYQYAIDLVEQKLSNKTKISWNELIEAANGYPSDTWFNPSTYTQFKDGVDQQAVEKRADDELYAEFTAYLLQAQKLGLFDCNYQHPVLKIFQSIKS